MKIALVRPNIGRLEHSLFVDEARMEPLELAVLAGLTPDEHELVTFDDRVEEINYGAPVDFAAAGNLKPRYECGIGIAHPGSLLDRSVYVFADIFRSRTTRNSWIW